MDCGEAVNTISIKSADKATYPLKPFEQVAKIGDEGHREEDLDKNQKAPVELIQKFLQAVKKPDMNLARNLCRMILVFEPDYPEAREFLTLIQKKLRQDNEDNNDEQEESSSSGSSSSLDDDEFEGKKQLV